MMILYQKYPNIWGLIGLFIRNNFAVSNNKTATKQSDRTEKYSKDSLKVMFG